MSPHTMRPIWPLNGTRNGMTTWLHQLGLAGQVDAVEREDDLGQIDAGEYDRPGLPLPNELMRVRTSHRGAQWPVAASRLARDGEVPFVRQAAQLLSPGLPAPASPPLVA